MPQVTSPQKYLLFDDPGEKLDPAYLIGIFRRRYLAFLVPSLLVGMLGVALVALQKPIFRSEGRILVESPEIPPDLVRPTITEVAEQRVLVIQQKIMSRDKLLAEINKYGLFPKERLSMSGTELLDLMRARTDIRPVEPDVEAYKRQSVPTIAFTLTFDYEIPDLAMKVANDFLTEILDEDATTRSNSAAQTTKFLEQEVRRIQSQHDAVVSQLSAAVAQQKQDIARAAQLPQDQDEQDSDETKLQKRNLSGLEAELVQKSTVYSDAHPVIIRLKKSIADLKQLIASAPKVKVPQDGGARMTANAGKADTTESVDVLILKQQELDIARILEDATKKLNEARLGENMERGQQGERLRVIEQPSLPQKPIRPQKWRWLAVAIFLAGVVGAGTVLAVETFDGTIRRGRDLTVLLDNHLIAAVPYLAAPGERLKIALRDTLVCASVVMAVGLLIGSALAMGISLDFNKFGRFG